MKKTIYILFINIAVCCTLVVFIEIFGQLAFYSLKGHWIYEKYSIHKEIFQIHPYLVSRLRSNIKVDFNGKTISGTDIHTRWTGAPKDDDGLIKIAILGGSTAFGVGVTDDDTWPAMLQKRLGNEYAVINYGMPGYSTAEAIIQMALIVPEKKPDIVIIHQGWNDIRSYHIDGTGVDYYMHGVMQFSNLGISDLVSQPSFLNEASEVSALFKLLKKLAVESTSGGSHPPPEPYFDTPDRFIDKMYARNLETLYSLAKHINAKSVFIPQILNYQAYKGKKVSRKWTPKIQDDALPILMEEFNNIMSKVCDNKRDDCAVLDAVRDVVWQSSDFVDDGHLSRQGGEKLVEKLVAQLNLYE